MNVLQHIPKIVVLVLFVWTGWVTYSYFFDVTTPVVTLCGVDQDTYYAGDVQCVVRSNKNGEISLWLDGQSLLSNSKIKAKQDSSAFAIPTKTLANGKHHFKVECTDNTFYKNKTIIDRDFYVDNMPLQAAFINTGASTYKVFQGRTLHIQLQTNKDIKIAKISALAHEFMCYPESKNSKVYECFIPIECEEQANEYLFSVNIEDHVGNRLHLDNKFQIVMYPFKKEVITVTQNKVQEEKSLGKDGKDLENDLLSLFAQSPQEKLWRGPFCTPIEIQRVSCDFGTIRTTQHKGRYAHKAVDVVNAPKSVVWASQDGIVVLKDRFAPSGNTVVIDHGLGIMSLFYHLDDFADSLAVGQKIAQGNPIGTIGKTGFATGYHLHWEMRINNVAIDPLQWIKPTF